MKKKMKRFRHIILIYFLVIGIFAGVNFSFMNVVNAIDEIFTDDFEEYLVGDDYGSNAYLSWENVSGDDFDIYGTHGVEQDLLVAYSSSDQWLSKGQHKPDLGYINASSGFHGFGINYRAYENLQGSQSSVYTTFNFTNATNFIVSRIKLYAIWSTGGVPSDYCTLSYWDLTGEHMIGGANYKKAANKEYRFLVTYLGENNYNYSIYDPENRYIDGATSTGLVSGVQFTSDEDMLLYDCEIYTKGSVYGGSILLDNYSMYLNSGNITINVYNESSPSNSISNYAITVYTSDYLIKYYEFNLNNPTVINNTFIGNGFRYFMINASGYSSRTYYTDININDNYFIDVYLSPSDIAHLYYIEVIDKYGQTISNSNIVISKLINGHIYEISSGITNNDGLYPVYLIGGDNYKINISASGYSSLVLDDFTTDPDNYGIDYPITFNLEETYTSITNISMDSMVLSPYNSTTMKIRYLNLNYNNSFVNFAIFDVVGSSLLASYNISDDPDNITILFNFSGYGLVGDILKVVANAYRNDTDHITLVGYFNVEQSRRYTSINSYIAVIFSISICLFGLTIAHPKKTLGPIGIIVIIISIGITAYADQTWFVHLIQAIEIILLLFTILVFKEEGIHAV